ncbi:MAG: 3-phosphoglycerate dehydrogenase, partial [Spirochaetia bacterium]|nr:3-phosphoglycerate dehydrogenase [Spirochaetia bacterium]
MKAVVLIPEDIAEVGKDYLRERGYSIRMGRGTDKASLLAD